MNPAEILKKLESMANPESVKGMARFGIRSENAYGVSTPQLRKLAEQISKRNLLLNQAAIDVCEEIKTLNSKAARWIANDALQELTSEEIQKRLH